VNSGIHSIYVLTQFRSQSLLQHLSEGWQIGGILKNQFIIPVPAQMRSVGETWYQGTADAIYQNINLIEQADPHVVAIFGADHIYRMNVAHMVEFHQHLNAACSVAALPVPRKHAYEFGVIETDAENRIIGFHEKNPNAPPIPGRSGHVFASMGNYLFSTRALLKALHEDAADEASSHDFGRDILPRLVTDHQAIYAYDYQTNKIPDEPEVVEPYWRDVGNIDAYWEASMDLRAIKPALNLYNRKWPLRTSSYPDPPAKFTFDEHNRRGEAVDSIVSGGCILSGGRVKNSILSRGVRVHAGAMVEDSVILDNCDIGRRAKIRRAILDKNVRVPEDATIGYDPVQDAKLYHVTESGIVVVEGNRSPVEISTVFV
ncbi:MAG TPA: glucose-1-phosphate adenylyltransferase, partial [Bryobacteraceae bacterium]|nr:glucose-1-phosphate adenylyltransferase [Bryobacteraceae bacterium]